MRKSVIKSDPGYSPDGYLYEVSLNGIAVPDAITADEEYGYILAYERDKDGKLIMVGGDHFKTMELHGEVKIRRKPNAKAKKEGI